MDVWDIVLRGIGAFYVFAGVVALRAMLMSLILDRAIAAMGAKPVPRAQAAQALTLAVFSGLVLIGGAALLLRLELALPLFLVSVVAQAAYLFLAAPMYFDRHDEPDPRGRRQTTNAFVIYTLATSLITWAWSRGLLREVHEVSPPALALVGGAVLAYLGYVATQYVTIIKRRMTD